MLALPSSKENSMLLLRIFLLLLVSPTLCLAQGASGDVPATPLSAAEKQSVQARADALHKEANDRRSAADTRQREDKAACTQRFLVNACLEDADNRHRNELGAVRKLELEGNRLQRELKAREHAEDAARAPSEAEMQADAIRQRQLQKEQLRDFERRGVDRATRKQEGAAQEAAQKKQLEQHAATRRQQAQRAADARLRAEEARKQTAAYQAAQESARKRSAEASAKP
jgi:hypothetical protein